MSITYVFITYMSIVKKFIVEMTPETHELLKAQCKQEGLTLTQFFRNKINEAVGPVGSSQGLAQMQANGIISQGMPPMNIGPDGAYQEETIEYEK